MTEILEEMSGEQPAGPLSEKARKRSGGRQVSLLDCFSSTRAGAAAAVQPPCSTRLEGRSPPGDLPPASSSGFVMPFTPPFSPASSLRTESVFQSEAISESLRQSEATSESLNQSEATSESKVDLFDDLRRQQEEADEIFARQLQREANLDLTPDRKRSRAPASALQSPKMSNSYLQSPRMSTSALQSPRMSTSALQSPRTCGKRHRTVACNRCPLGCSLVDPWVKSGQGQSTIG